MALQYNLTTKNPYQGSNQATLADIKEERNYKSDAWITFLQAKGIDKKLVGARKMGVYLRTFTDERKKNESGKVERITRPVGFVVFNADHLTDIEEEK